MLLVNIKHKKEVIISLTMLLKVATFGLEQGLIVVLAIELYTRHTRHTAMRVPVRACDACDTRNSSILAA